MTLDDWLRAARLARRDEARGLTLVWLGGHGVHAVDDQGREVSFWNIASHDAEATEAEVLASMDAAIATGGYP
ncbi:MAG: hypothetical protein K6U87_06040 [Firmicutes bacterium]|nr:hypothetical protein [Bacillota bacterium]